MRVSSEPRVKEFFRDKGSKSEEQHVPKGNKKEQRTVLYSLETGRDPRPGSDEPATGEARVPSCLWALVPHLLHERGELDSVCVLFQNLTPVANLLSEFTSFKNKALQPPQPAAEEEQLPVSFCPNPLGKYQELPAQNFKKPKWI